MRPLSSVLEPGGEGFSVSDLAAAVADDDLYVDQFTDEEMAWLRSDPGLTALDEPWLSGLDEIARSVAVESGRRSLLARGMGLFGDDGDLQVGGPAGLVIDLRRAALVSTRVRLESRSSARAHQAAFFLAAEDLVMLEDVDPLGFHSFVLMSVDRAVAAFAATLDPTGSAGDVSGPVQEVEEIDALDPSLDHLKQEATQIAMVTSARPTGTRARTISVYCLPGAVWAFRGWESPTAARYQLGRCSIGDIVALARGMMTGLETG